MWPFTRNNSKLAALQEQNALLQAQNEQLRSFSLADPAFAAFIGVSLPNSNSPAVSDDTLLSVAPFWAAVRYISEGIASFSLNGYRRQPDGDIFPDPDHPVSRLFNGRVHPHYTTFDFLQALVANACFGGGCARIHWDYETMRPRYLELLPRGCWSVEQTSTGELLYRVHGFADGRQVNVALPATDVIHIKGFTTNAIDGRQVSLVHRTNMSAALSSQIYPEEYFANGAHIAGIVEAGPGFTPAQVRQMEQNYNKAYGGAQNAGKTPWLDAGHKYVRTGSTMQEAALIDFRRLTVEDVSRITKVPVNLLAHNQHSTFTNMEQQSLDFRVHCLTPWAVKLEEEFRTKLYSTREIATRSRFLSFDMSSMMEGDMEAQSKFYPAMVGAGIMTVNEVRARRKLNRVEGGDELFIQQNLMPMNLAVDLLKAKYAAPDDPGGETQTDEQENGAPQAN